jgi:hypothetical protein
MRRLVRPPVGLLQRPLRLRAMPLEFEVRNGVEALQVRSMCNLYSMATDERLIRDLFKILRDGGTPRLLDQMRRFARDHG